MGLQVFGTDRSENGVIGQLGAVDDALVKKGVLLNSLDDIVMLGTGSGHQVVVRGDVIGHIGGMTLGDSALDANQRLTIASDASVIGSTFSGAVIYGSNSVVRNDGQLGGGTNAISLYGDDTGTTSRLFNTGLIVTESLSAAAIYRNGEEDFRLVNDGKISSKADYAYDGTDSSGRQTIINSGRFDGGIIFGDANDRYIGAGGRVVGIISGEVGNDRLTGGSRADQLAGDEGRDILKGSKGSDEFIYHLMNDTHVDRSGRDLIQDFSHHQGDRIILNELDANIGGANDAFTFIGKNDFSNTPGELRYYFSGNKTFIEGTVDADGQADFMIELKGRIKLVEDDFVL
ncbi:calcium-binding protein [Rhizobium sp. LjRoot254]|uniref:calcium-binding protein n=1 Tax=Rhizobium sp. LjRoot254 TaxID=3342297 RepID=UPI003ECC7636